MPYFPRGPAKRGRCPRTNSARSPGEEDAEQDPVEDVVLLGAVPAVDGLPQSGPCRHPEGARTRRGRVCPGLIERARHIDQRGSLTVSRHGLRARRTPVLGGPRRCRRSSALLMPRDETGRPGLHGGPPRSEREHLRSSGQNVHPHEFWPFGQNSCVSEPARIRVSLCAAIGWGAGGASVTVDIAAGAAEDDAGNPSVAADQFSIVADLTQVPVNRSPVPGPA